jgi:hypothetical protein
MRDRDRANKNEIEIFAFSVTSNDFPHDMLLLTFHRISAQNYGADVSFIKIISAKALDPDRPIREADIDRLLLHKALGN